MSYVHLRFLQKTVELGSFRGAAREFNLSPSVVSHHIFQLEKRLGVTLLYRSTRKLSLTQDGVKLFASAKAMLISAENGLNMIAEKSLEPSGKLNITVPAVLIKSPLVKKIATFAQAFPKIVLSINFSDVQQDLIHEGIDLAIRIGALKNSALKSKRLFDMKRKLIVAPDFMANYKSPREPQDLMGWDWIGLKMRPNNKVLISDAGKKFLINFEPKITVDSVDAVCQLAISGLGLATPPAFLVEEEIKSGHLIEPLPNWSVETLTVYAVWPPNASKESLTFRFIQFLDSMTEL